MSFAQAPGDTAFSSPDILLKANQIVGKPKPDFCPLIPVSRSHWYQGLRSGKYPPPDVRLSERSVFWRFSTIQKWIIANSGPQAEGLANV